MSSRGRTRQELNEAVRQAFRRHNHEMSLLRQAVAARLRLNLTDLQVLSMLYDAGPLTATQIAEGTGLTSGAVTGVIDRLEEAGFASREGAPEDRRRVVVRPRAEREPEIRALYDPLAEASRAQLGEMSVAEIELVEAFLGGAADLVRQQAARLRETSAGPAEAGDGTARSAPLGGRTRARLELRGGPAHLTVRGGAPAGLLYQAGFEGRAPRVQLEGDTLAVAYPRERLFGGRRSRGDLALSAEVRWEIELRGGAARVDFELAEVPVRAVELTGGVSNVSLSLPRPEGMARLRISGGANRLAVLRPAGVAARLHLTGGVAQLALDAQRLGAVGGEAWLETPGFAAAAPRWEVEVSGGASALSVGVR